jgi:hypothetical protein
MDHPLLFGFYGAPVAYRNSLMIRWVIPHRGGRIQSPLEGQRDFAIAQPANLAQIPPVPLKKQVVASLRLHLLKFYGTPGRIPIDKLRTSSPAAYGFEVQGALNSKMS